MTLSKGQTFVLRLLNRFGPATDSDLIAKARKSYHRYPSASGIRTRRNELVLKGLIRNSGVRNANGITSKIWSLTPAGKRTATKLFSKISA